MLYVLTLDQRSSRDRHDLVAALVDRLNARRRSDGLLRPFERTAGDELQGVLSTPEAVVEVVLDLVREDAWHVGLGIGEADDPLPPSTRAGSGAAFVHARRAVTRAKMSPHHLSVVGSGSVGGGVVGSGGVGAGDYRAAHVETVLWLLAAIVSRRSERGWEVADMLAKGASRAGVAAALGISASAVSQRVKTAGVVEEERGRDLAVALLAQGSR